MESGRNNRGTHDSGLCTFVIRNTTQDECIIFCGTFERYE